MAGNQGRSYSPLLLKAASGLMALCIAAYIVGPPLYWHLIEALAAVGHSSSSSSECPSCLCDCSSQRRLSVPKDFLNTSFPGDCVKNDPGMSSDTDKNFEELLLEELKVKESEALENQHRTDMALLEAKKTASQFQKDADKCNSGMETCEEAREKSEGALMEQKKVTAMWELRALQRGWREHSSNRLHSRSR